MAVLNYMEPADFDSSDYSDSPRAPASKASNRGPCDNGASSSGRNANGANTNTGSAGTTCRRRKRNIARKDDELTPDQKRRDVNPSASTSRVKATGTGNLTRAEAKDSLLEGMQRDKVDAQDTAAWDRSSKESLLRFCMEMAQRFFLELLAADKDITGDGVLKPGPSPDEICHELLVLAAMYVTTSASFFKIK